MLNILFLLNPQAPNQVYFEEREISSNRGTLINVFHGRHTKEGPHREQFWYFVKIVLKRDYNLKIHRNREPFLQNKGTFFIFKIGDGTALPPSPLLLTLLMLQI